MPAARSPGPRRRGYLWPGLIALALAVAVAAWLGVATRRGDEPESMDAIQAAAGAERWGEVEARLGRWIAMYPDDGQAHLMLGVALVALGRNDHAVAALRRVAPSDPARPRAMAIVGELEILAQRAPEAERALREAANLDPLALEPRQRLVYLLSLEQRNGEARDVLWEMYRATRDPRILIDLVLESWAVEMDTRSMGPAIDELLARSPADPYLKRVKGLSLLMQNQTEEALPFLRDAAGSITGDPLGRFALAECRLALGSFDDDESILGECPEEPSNAARWWLMRGRLEEVLGRPEDALASFGEALNAHPEDIEAHFRFGQALTRAGDPEQGTAHLERAEALKATHASVRAEFEAVRRKGFEEDADLYERLGALCREVGLKAEARAWYELAIQLDPSRSAAQVALGELLRFPSLYPTLLSRPILDTARSPASITPGDRSTAERATAGPILLEDITERAGINYQYECGERGDMYLGDTMGGGVGLIDFDGDGRLDIYFVNGGRLPGDTDAPAGSNRLYRNRGDGTFEDVTESAGVAGRGYGMGCEVGDIDNDGHADLFATGLGQTVLYRNRGDGTFEDVTESAGVGSDRWTTAAGFGDFDRDGNLDLVVITYVEADPRDVPPCRDHTNRAIHCSPRRFVAQADLLFRNNGDGTFTDVSDLAGFDEAPDGLGLGLAIADFDGDGRLDIFVANDLASDFLFINRGDFRFEEVAMASGVACNGAARPTSSMGVVADDLDGDGRIDLFITNFLNEPNTLFRGLGRSLYADETLAANLHTASLPVTGFGTAAIDFDNDGRLDLFVANGHVDDQPWINSPMEQAPHAFHGLGDGRFAPADSARSPYLTRRVVGRGVAAGDLDNDGRVDLVVVHRDTPAVILRNVSPSGHWLGLRLRGDQSGGTPIGARVACRVDGREQVRWLTSGTSYLSAHDQRLWFGLGSSNRVESLEVLWPSGLRQRWDDLPADRILELREGEDSPRPAP